MSRRVAIMVGTLALAGGCYGGLGNPQLGYKVSHGNAIAAPGTSRGVTSTIVYRDQGGFLSQIVLALPRVLAQPTDDGWTLQSCDGTWCHYTATQDSLDQADADQAEWREKVLQGPTSLESSLEYSSTSLGGDTDGLRVGFAYPLFAEGPLLMKAGLAFGTYIMRERTTRFLTGDGLIEEMMPADDTTSSLLAVPIRFMVVLPAELLASYQFEWNLLSYLDGGKLPGETYHPTLSRFGLDTMLAPYIHAGVELQIDGLGWRSSTIGAELGLAF